MTATRIEELLSAGETDDPTGRAVPTLAAVHLRDAGPRREKHPFKPYRWRDPTRRRDPKLAGVAEDGW
ncbi:hypothetical protein [Actinoallomurus rhizosphaericola]|uniref:hypothetical protein n=1 Tax=Actinoallomurus rhizosphaericola TaxID=2952536 RepID=UPI002093C4B2|nr:hypothetical protein [Actinoallomurus rhizosphaericola]MCO5999787.1 hypothetical protein [Actinoallomurus rhizosphaericola]